MISQAQIVRLVRTHQFARLVERVLDNGRPCSAGIRRRLVSPQIVSVAGLALAIQRYIELNYFGRSLEGDRLIRRLLSLQDPATGLFGGADASDDDRLVATALAIRALLDCLAADVECQFAPPAELAGQGSGFGKTCGPDGDDARNSVTFSTASALQRAAETLITCHALEQMHGGTAETAAIIEWQLGDAPHPDSRSPQSLLESLAGFATKMYNARNPLAEAA